METPKKRAAEAGGRGSNIAEGAGEQGRISLSIPPSDEWHTLFVPLYQMPDPSFALVEEYGVIGTN